MRNQLLRDTDWASMDHSLEVRVPLVDAVLLKRVSRLMVGQRNATGKALIGNSPKKPLPPCILERKKTGFATPIETWLQRAPQLQAWRCVPALTGARCPWARRWAYIVAGAIGSAYDAVHASAA